MNPFEFARKFSKLNESMIIQLAGESVVENESSVLHSIKGQLWDGKTSKGENIHPSYLEDPFFKSQNQAKSYAAWKNSITKNPDRDEFSPNLFINGYFYDSLKIDSSSFLVDSNSFGKPIIQKYGNETFSMNAKKEENKEAIKDIKVSLIDKIKKLWQS